MSLHREYGCFVEREAVLADVYIAFPVLTHTVANRGAKFCNRKLFYDLRIMYISTAEPFCNQLFSILQRCHISLFCNWLVFGFCLRYDPLVAYFLSKKLAARD